MIHFLTRSRASVFFSLILFIHLEAEETPIYKNSQAPLEARVQALFQAMTPAERLSILDGTSFTTQPIPRLGVPPMEMVDASQGVRGGSGPTKGHATVFSSGVLLAATWDVDLAGRIGQGIGMEALNKGSGAQVLLGPGVNIIRAPLCGRNGEYFSEDPYLAARLAVAYIKGLQKTGCSACVKHYACNNQEFERHSIDVQVGERALREIYTPAFIAAVKEAGVWAVMSSYNKVNGEPASDNWYLQKEILKKEAGFDGVIMTDWGGCHSTHCVDSGCDLEMPGGPFLKPEAVRRAILSGDLQAENVNDAVRRVLRTIIRVGLLDGPRPTDPAQVNSPEHQKLALEAAEKGIVLLKNDKNILPIDPSTTHSIALIGPSCKDWMMRTGGSAGVDPVQSVNAYDGIVQRAGSGITITYDPGCSTSYTGVAVPSSVLKPIDGTGQGLTGEYFNGFTFASPPAATRLDPTVDFSFKNEQACPPGFKAENFGARWSGSLTAPSTGTYHMFVSSDSGARLFLDDQPVYDTWPGSDSSVYPGRVDLVAGHSYRVRLEFVRLGKEGYVTWNWRTPDENLFKQAVDTARKADVAVVFVGSTGEGEERDRLSMELPGPQNELIRAVVAANPKTIVVLNNGGPVLVSNWVDQVPGLIEALYPAQAGGEALAKILFGEVNPSGKLTYTIGRAREDYPDFKNYPLRPGTFKLQRGHQGDIVDYAEGIYVGYRYFDKKAINPSFPFGFGLSYTSFQYANLKLSSSTISPTDKLTVTADITNTGRLPGAEVVELYLEPKDTIIDRPVRELKGFTRVELRAKETKSVTFTLTPQDLAYCDVPGKQWKADAGHYSIELGSSSRDLRATTEMALTSPYLWPVPGMGTKSPSITSSQQE